MGTWALPNTKEKAEKLQQLLSTPFYSDNKATSKLYNLFGDDRLFDDIDDIKAEFGKRYDLRDTVKEHIKALVEYYESKPECFYVKFDDTALEILKNIIKDI